MLLLWFGGIIVAGPNDHCQHRSMLQLLNVFVHFIPRQAECVNQYAVIIDNMLRVGHPV